MLRQELETGYFKWIERPGEDLGVFDNEGDYEECSSRVHCNCSHWSLGLSMKYDEERAEYVVDSSGEEEALAALNDPKGGRHHVIVWGGDHNNVYFPYFREYKDRLPESLMQGPDGKYLELHDPLILGGEGIPMPAIDDETLIGMNCRMMGEQAKRLKGNQYVKAYMLGMEELYPEYFDLGEGDFRPASWKHFEAWCRKEELAVPSKEEVTGEELTQARMSWLQYREQAMADRCGNYYEAILREDGGHLIYYPTHGSAMCGNNRARLGQQPEKLACQCDGMEMGHILVESDEERRNVLLLSHFTSFGSPVIVPRLGNKRVDLNAAGGGRSFSAVTLRRLVYECLGMGVDKIFPIHWTSRLHDGEWFIKNTEAESECRKVFDEITKAADVLAGMGRLQPEAGILAGSAQWLERWNPRWTGMMQDAFALHYHMTIVSDDLVGKHLVKKMPVLIVADNGRLMRKTFLRLVEYADAGGRILLWGEFARVDETGAPYKEEEKQEFTDHPNVVRSDAGEAKERDLRELFLAGPEYGISGERYRYRPVRLEELCAPVCESGDCVLRPFAVGSQQDLRELNIYPLTDRSTLAAVCINNGPERLEFTIEPDRRLMKNTVVWDVCEKNICGSTVTMEPFSTKLLWFFDPELSKETSRDVAAAEDLFDTWREAGADVSPYRLHYAHMRCGSLKVKRAALARTLLESLAVAVTARREEQGAVISCRVLDGTGGEAEHVTVMLRMTPGDFRWKECVLSGGAYVCRLTEEELPVYYDVKEKCYRTVRGRIRLVIDAQKGDRRGGTVTEMEI